MSFKIIDEHNLDSLKKKIGQLHIFNCSDYTNSFISRRIECRLRALNINSYLAYSVVLEKSAEERKNLLKEMTIHVTNFFRDAETFETIKEDVIPLIVKLKQERNEFTLNVWSAGCSTGEEAYSVAILFKEALAKYAKKFNTRIIATDIDGVSIGSAKRGIYEEKQLREMKKEYISKYFDKFATDKRITFYKIKDAIKEMVEFRIGDILSPFKPKDLDMIFCRNTVIYFDLEKKSGLYVDFYKILNNGGFFIMGKTETLMGPAKDMFQTFDLREKIYCKEET